MYLSEKLKYFLVQKKNVWIKIEHLNGPFEFTAVVKGYFNLMFGTDPQTNITVVCMYQSGF